MKDFLRRFLGILTLKTSYRRNDDVTHPRVSEDAVQEYINFSLVGPVSMEI